MYLCRKLKVDFSLEVSYLISEMQKDNFFLNKQDLCPSEFYSTKLPYKFPKKIENVTIYYKKNCEYALKKNLINPP